MPLVESHSRVTEVATGALRRITVFMYSNFDGATASPCKQDHARLYLRILSSLFDVLPLAHPLLLAATASANTCE